MDVRSRLALAIIVELLYMALSRVIAYAGLPTFAEVEIWRTPLRLMTALIQWILMADVIFGEREVNAPVDRRRLCVALAMLWLTPLLTGDYEASVRDSVIVAAASFPVAIHEEIFFRGIVQTLLVRRFGAIAGICVSTLIFTAWHIGVADPSLLNFTLIAMAGLGCALIYSGTDSLLLVVLVHGLYDALLGIPGKAPFPLEWALAPMLLTVLLLLPRSRS